MIKSMTAYGQGRSPHHSGFWLLEIKCVNGKFLDCHLRIPASLSPLEERIKKHVAGRLARGRVNISVSLSGAPESQPRLSLNRALLMEYKKIWRELEEELGVSLGAPNPGMLPRDLVLAGEDSPDGEVLWQELLPALNQALSEVCAMRLAEGANLAADLRARLFSLEEMLRQLTDKAPEIVDNYRQRLGERIARLLGEVEPDPQRLAQEVAIMADRCDISEEMVRAASHLRQFRGFLDCGGPVGRKLDFVVQELNREANTMASKSPDAQAQAMVVEIKAELERIREQIQNIE